MQTYPVDAFDDHQKNIEADRKRRLRIEADQTAYDALHPDTINGYDVRKTVRAYAECLLWSETAEGDRSFTGMGFEPESFDSAANDRLWADVVAFYQAAGDLLTDQQGYLARITSEGYCDASSAIGHDLALTRNGHGAGFWSRQLPGTLGDDLTAVCRKLGERNLYLTDPDADGQREVAVS